MENAESRVVPPLYVSPRLYVFSRNSCFFGRFLFFFSQFFSASCTLFVKPFYFNNYLPLRRQRSRTKIVFPRYLPPTRFFAQYTQPHLQQPTSLLIPFSILLSRAASTLLIFSSFLTRAVTLFSILAVARRGGGETQL